MHARGEQDEHGHLGHVEGEGRRLLEERFCLVLHQRVDEGSALPEALGEEALLGNVAPDVLAIDGIVEDLAHELEHLGLHRRPGGGVVERTPRLEREAEDRVLLLLERADLPFEVDLLIEGEHHAGEFLLPAEMAAALLGDADGELVGGGARVLALSPRRAAPRGRLVEVVWFVAVKQLHGLSFVRRTAGPRGPRPYTGSSAGRASARATSCRRGSP